MSHRLFATSVVALVMALPACGGKSDTPKPNGTKTGAQASTAQTPVDDAEKKAVEEVAKAALSAYRDKNIERLADLGPPSARERTVFIEPRNPNYERLLGEKTWRMRSLKTWDGELKGFRIGKDVAQVKFADHPDDPKRVVGIELLKTGGKWRFHDLIEQDRKLYANGKLVITLPPDLLKPKQAPE